METMMSLINTEVKPFKATAFQNGKFIEVTEADLKGKWSVVFFYPADFTFVCPTELGDLADNYEEFKKLGVEPFYEEQTGNMLGKNFVVTGTLSSMGRDEAGKEIRSRGGILQTAINKNTTYLVAGKSVGKTKLEKANRLGIEILTEEQFLKMIK